MLAANHKVDISVLRLGVHTYNAAAITPVTPDLRYRRPAGSTRRASRTERSRPAPGLPCALKMMLNNIKAAFNTRLV
jgi:hypothetical protein